MPLAYDEPMPTRWADLQMLQTRVRPVRSILESSVLRVFIGSIVGLLLQAATHETTITTAARDNLAVKMLQTIVGDNPVLPGDHADPSIIRIGDTYWATNTSSAWAPIFPIFSSRDLKTWKPEGSIFSDSPDWSSGNFWAPEFTLDQGHVRVYYTAQKVDGPLCVAVATADRPQGPYIDHGPMVCQDVGSIDPSFIRDEHGKPYLIWKKDANSVGRATTIFAQETTPDGLKLVGQSYKLIENDSRWERQVVEAPCIFRRDGWFYLIYAGAACCGRSCDYGVGIARSRKLLGPWLKDPDNPIIAGNNKWTCPGHGSVVESSKGDYYFLYHAYSKQGSVYSGREGLMDQMTWNAKDWPVVNGGHGPSSGGAVMTYPIDDNFSGVTLGLRWEWPIYAKPDVNLSDGSLTLSPNPKLSADFLGGILAQSTSMLTYTASATLLTDDMSPGELAGLAIIGDQWNAVGLSVQNGRSAVQWRRDKGIWKSLATAPLPPARQIYLRLESKNGTLFSARYSSDGINWKGLGTPIDVSSLPPWDLGLRVGLTCGGTGGARARFTGFHVEAVPSAQTRREE